PSRHRRRLAAGENRDPRVVSQLAQVELRARFLVHAGDRHPAIQKKARRRPAGAPQPVDQHRAEFALAPGDSHRSFRVERERSAKRIERIQKRTITLGSAHPESSKWWWSGAMRNTRLPRSLNEVTWMMTDRASSTHTPPTTARRLSCLARTATLPMAAPRDSDPTSPMNTSAGWELNQRKPRLAPTSAPQKTATSPTPET